MYFLHHNFHYNCDPIYGYWAQPLLGLTIYLYCEFWISYYGWFCAWQLKYTSIPSSLSPPHRIASLLSLSACSLLLVFFLELPTPFSPLIPLFIALDKWRCYDYFSLLVRIKVQFHCI